MNLHKLTVHWHRGKRSYTSSSGFRYIFSITVAFVLDTIDDNGDDIIDENRKNRISFDKTSPHGGTGTTEVSSSVLT